MKRSLHTFNTYIPYVHCLRGIQGTYVVSNQYVRCLPEHREHMRMFLGGVIHMLNAPRILSVGWK